MDITKIVLSIITTALVGYIFFYHPADAEAKAEKTIFRFSSGKEMTKFFEGFRENVYIDTTGHKTIGYGFNISDPEVKKLVTINELAFGMKKDQADKIFDTLYSRAWEDAKDIFGVSWYRINDIQRFILADMVYNLGKSGVLKFNRMIACIKLGKYNLAAQEMEDSRWYHQTGQRAKHHVENFCK